MDEPEAPRKIFAPQISAESTTLKGDFKKRALVGWTILIASKFLYVLKEAFENIFV